MRIIAWIAHRFGVVLVHEAELIAMERQHRTLQRYAADLSAFGNERVLRIGLERE